MNPAIALTGALFDGLTIDEPDGAIIIQDDIILWSGPRKSFPFPLDDAIEVPYIFPGLVDVHHHGAVGADYKDDKEGAIAAAAHHNSQGSTSLIASVVSATNEQMLANIAVLRKLEAKGVIDGIHLEGPFISHAKKGAHDPNVIAEGNPEWFKSWCKAGRGAIKSITLAMETAHYDELIAICRTFNVIPSLGHSDADANATIHALDADRRANRPENGPFTVTHLFNAMNSIHHREPGPIPIFLHQANDPKNNVTVEIIPDGIHLNGEIVKMVFDNLGESNGVIMITDSMSATGLGDGEYMLGTLEVIVKDGVARLKTADGSPGSIAGGISRMYDNVIRCIRDWNIPKDQVVRAATSTPAKFYGLPDRGQLIAGMRADLLLLNEDLERIGVYRAGKRL